MLPFNTAMVHKIAKGLEGEDVVRLEKGEDVVEGAVRDVQMVPYIA